MTIKALVVDDSAFFRRMITKILSDSPEFAVVGGAANGLEAVELVKKLQPDIVTMDVAMPVMDGITAVRKIMSTHPTPILMLSALTERGAQATLEALEAGALDFLPKRMADISRTNAEAESLFRSRIRALARRPKPGDPAAKPAARSYAGPVSAIATAEPAPKPKTNERPAAVRLVAIGASTGGPLAMQRVLAALPADFPVPIVVVLHMPATFTQTFAQRLDQLCPLSVKEAEEGDELKLGHVYIAPGGKQMLLKKSAAKVNIQIADSEPGQNYHPCVDVTFKSVAGVYGGEVLAVVMTGMGADGCEGARLLSKSGASVWAQDEQSCVVYGMPMAVVNAGLADRVLRLDEIGARLAKEVKAWTS